MKTVYEIQHRGGEWVCYERHPIPGGVDQALVARDTKVTALRDGRKFLVENGSCFKAERSMVGVV